MEEPTKEQLKEWEKKWKKFHRSLPKKVVFEQGGLRLAFYHDGSGGYSTEPCLKLSLWQRIWKRFFGQGRKYGTEGT